MQIIGQMAGAIANTARKQPLLTAGLALSVAELLTHHNDTVKGILKPSSCYRQLKMTVNSLNIFNIWNIIPKGQFFFQKLPHTAQFGLFSKIFITNQMAKYGLTTSFGCESINDLPISTPTMKKYTHGLAALWHGYAGYKIAKIILFNKEQPLSFSNLKDLNLSTGCSIALIAIPLVAHIGLTHCHYQQSTDPTNENHKKSEATLKTILSAACFLQFVAFNYQMSDITLSAQKYQINA